MHLMTAFAFGRLARVNAFHRSPGSSVTLEHPYRLCPSRVATPVQAYLMPY